MEVKDEQPNTPVQVAKDNIREMIMRMADNDTEKAKDIWDKVSEKDLKALRGNELREVWDKVKELYGSHQNNK